MLPVCELEKTPKRNGLLNSRPDLFHVNVKLAYGTMQTYVLLQAMSFLLVNNTSVHVC